MTTRLLWHSRLSRRRRGHVVEAARASGYPGASDDGTGLLVPHPDNDVGPIHMFLAGAGRSPKLFSGLEVG